MKSPIKRVASKQKASKLGAKAVGKAVGKKVLPAWVAYEALKGVKSAKTLGGKTRALADLTLPTMAMGMIYDGTTAKARKEYQAQRVISGDRGINPTTNPNQYNKALAKARRPR